MKRFEDPESKCFIAYEREDNWRDFGYDKRYLDALASVFLVNGNNNVVATVHKVSDTFYLSYNCNASNIDAKVLSIISQLINNNNPKSLLAHHMAYNEIDLYGVVGLYLQYYEVEEKIKTQALAFIKKVQALAFIKKVQAFKKSKVQDDTSINNITSEYFTLLQMLIASDNPDLDLLKVELRIKIMSQSSLKCLWRTLFQ